jgi:hypothetical protein
LLKRVILRLESDNSRIAVLEANVIDLATERAEEQFMAVYRDLIRTFRDMVSKSIGEKSWHELAQRLNDEESEVGEYEPITERKKDAGIWPVHTELHTAIEGHGLNWSAWFDLKLIADASNRASHQGKNLAATAALSQLTAGTRPVPLNLQKAVPALHVALEKLAAQEALAKKAQQARRTADQKPQR